MQFFIKRLLLKKISIDISGRRTMNKILKKKKWTDKLYIFTILLFALGFFNIIFAWLGFACMIIPFILLARDGKKTWCQSYCPRANLFTVLYRGKAKNSKPAPKWLSGKKAKTFFLIYFSFNLFILFMSTLMVFKGRINAMETVRFMIALRFLVQA
jgi:hypothetical protein